MSDKLISKDGSTQGFGDLSRLRLLCGLGVGWGVASAANSGSGKRVPTAPPCLFSACCLLCPGAFLSSAPRMPAQVSNSVCIFLHLISFPSPPDAQVPIPLGKKWEVGFKDGRGPPMIHLSPVLPLRSEASLRPSPQTAERWGISSPSASTPSTPSWTPGSLSFSERPSSNASSSGCVACVPLLSMGICRRPFPSLRRGEETHWLLLLSRLRKGAGCPCRPGAWDRWHH